MGNIYSMAQGYLTAKAGTSPENISNNDTDSLFSIKSSNRSEGKGEENLEQDDLWQPQVETTYECHCHCQICHVRPTSIKCDGSNGGIHPLDTEQSERLAMPSEIQHLQMSSRLSLKSSQTSMNPLIVEVCRTINSETFGKIASLFEDRWTIGNERANSSLKIGRIFEIKYLGSLETDRSNYIEKLERSGLCPRQEYTFFSSQCICNFGAHVRQNEALCNFISCGICMVLKSRFGYFAFGNPHVDGRYGPGIYSKLSSQAADRHATSCTTSPYRVSVVCSVTVCDELNGSAEDAKFKLDSERIMVTDSKAIFATYIICYEKA